MNSFNKPGNCNNHKIRSLLKWHIFYFKVFKPLCFRHYEAFCCPCFMVFAVGGMLAIGINAHGIISDSVDYRTSLSDFGLYTRFHF
jgi:hypothetical protein